MCIFSVYNGVLEATRSGPKVLTRPTQALANEKSAHCKWHACLGCSKVPEHVAEGPVVAPVVPASGCLSCISDCAMFSLPAPLHCLGFAVRRAEVLA